MLAPIVILLYKRPEHTQKTIEALAKNKYAMDSEVYIFCDGPKNEESMEDVKQVRKYVDTLPEKQLFKSIKITKANTNQGLANSVINGVSKIIQQYGKVIVLEDDIITSPDFLEYMNDALDYYEDNRKIWSISGYTFKMKFPKDYKRDIYLSYRGCSWGWATWKDRWEKVDWDVTDYIDFRLNLRARSRFNRGGRDMSLMLDMQMEGKIDSWAIRWCYAQHQMDMYTVYPVISRIMNIGLDGTGTHSGVNSEFDVTLRGENSRCKFDNLGMDLRIVKGFRDMFGMNVLYLLKCYIERLLRIK